MAPGRAGLGVGMVGWGGKALVLHSHSYREKFLKFSCLKIEGPGL